MEHDPDSPGASAVEAAQKLIDGGLFATPGSAPAARSEPAAPAAASTPTETQVASPAAAPQAEAPATNAEAQEEGYASLDDYLTKANLDRNAFLSLPVKAKVDGKELDVPLAKLVESYQISEHLSHKSNAFAEERRSWEAERNQARQQLAQQLQVAQQVAQLAHQEIMREYQGVSTADPARYLEAQQRLQAVANYFQQAQQASQQVSQATLQAEQQRLLDAIPEWREPTKFQEASKQLTSYASARGFTPAELSAVSDHRYMLILHDAARAKDLQAQVDTLKAQLEGKTAATLKQVRAAPPMASPGARIPQNPNSQRLANARAAIRSGNMRSLDQQAAVAQALLDAGAA